MTRENIIHGDSNRGLMSIILKKNSRKRHN